MLRHHYKIVHPDSTTTTVNDFEYPIRRTITKKEKRKARKLFRNALKKRYWFW